MPIVVDPAFPPVETEEYMPLNETDKGWVRDYVRTTHQRQGLGKLTGFIKDWGGTGAAVGILLFFVTQWGNYTEFRTHTGDRLDGIENRLSKIESGVLELRASQSPDVVLHEINGMEPSKFGGALSALQTAAQTPIGAKKPPQALLNGIAEKLSKTAPSAPDYWPAVLQFLQFASAGLAPANVPPPGTPPILKSSTVMFLSHNYFSGATIVLDGGSLDGDRFENCRVIFTDTPVKMKNVTFVNSVFELPVSSVPSPYIQQASKLLLASDLKTALIPSL